MNAEKINERIGSLDMPHAIVTRSKKLESKFHTVTTKLCNSIWKPRGNGGNVNEEPNHKQITVQLTGKRQQEKNVLKLHPIYIRTRVTGTNASQPQLRNYYIRKDLRREPSTSRKHKHNNPLQSNTNNQNHHAPQI